MNYELYHHGIKGQKWGIRRFQNPDGTLTPAGRKRVSKEYTKQINKFQRDLNRDEGSLFVKSYNAAADVMNKGKIDEYNKQQREKYGPNFTERDGYLEDYEKLFNKVYSEMSNKALADYSENNKHYRAAQELVKEYNMESWDDITILKIQRSN